MFDLNDTVMGSIEAPAHRAATDTQQGASLSSPAEARLIALATQNQANNVSTYLPECNIGEFMKQPGRFEALDKDGNQHITDEEIVEALKTGNYSDTEKITLRYMRSAIDYIENASDDEWFSENDGITRQDASQFKPFQPSLERNLQSDPLDKEQFKIWTDVLADKHGVRDTKVQAMTNALRHAVTSAIFAFKYGETATNIAGELNEAQHNVRDFFTETGDHWWKDSKADSYNNSVGFAIARRRIRRVTQATQSRWMTLCVPRTQPCRKAN